MVRYKCDPVTTDYADGTPAIRMVDDGSGMVYYKNGQIAIHVQTTDLGFIQQAFDDNRYRSVLMNFNEIGEGSCTHPPPKGASTGHPRYVCDKNRGKFVAEDGQITREWPWEAPIGSSWSPDIPEEWSFILNRWQNRAPAQQPRPPLSGPAWFCQQLLTDSRRVYVRPQLPVVQSDEQTKPDADVQV